MSTNLTSTATTEPTNNDIFFWKRLKFVKAKKGFKTFIQYKDPKIHREPTTEEDLFDTYSHFFGEEAAIKDLKSLVRRYKTKIENDPQQKEAYLYHAHKNCAKKPHSVEFCAGGGPIS